MNARTAPHAPFLAALDSQTEGSSGWLASRAGLLAVHLVDRWTEDPAIDAALEAVDDGPVRVLLQGLVDATRRARGRPSVAVGTALLAYGRRLYHEGASPLASDVYETFVRHAHAMGGDERLADAYLRLGVALRMHGQFDPALEAYAAARRLAGAAGDRRIVWLARIGAANVARTRGQLTEAAAMLDAVIADVAPVVVTLVGGDDVLARAMHDRGAVSAEAGERDQAVVLLYQALERYTDPQRRQRVLHDLAVVFVDLGMLDAGQDALAVLSATASEPYLRLLADCNLMWIAALAGQETVFERYRRALAEEPLTGELVTAYETSVIEGVRRFGGGAPRAPSRGGALPPQVASVADAVREMRALAGVG
jgi:tetratricopeptide (TPR) repeat protein